MDSDNTVIIGIDEAGRGPLIGDMVVSGVVARESVLKELIGKGLADSKQLTPSDRYRIFLEALSKGVVVVSIYIPPWRIDRENLNDLELKAMENILRILVKIVKPQPNTQVKIYVDEVKGRSSLLDNYSKKLLKNQVEFKMEAKADVLYSIVSLASIFAKVFRDVNLNALRKLVGDFGSGYPVDPQTIEWFKNTYRENKPPPVFLRRSWSNLKNLAPKWYQEKGREGKPGYKSLFDFAKR